MLTVLRSARISKVDPESKLSLDDLRAVARFVVSKEYWLRNGAPDKAVRTELNLAKWLHIHGLTISASSNLSEEDAMTEETNVATATEAPAEKKAKKPAVKKAKAEKAANGGPAKKEKGAKKPSKNAAANEERKARLAAKAKPEGATRERFDDTTQFKYVRALKEGEVIPMSSKRGEAFLAFIKEEGTVTQAKIVKSVPKITTTKQDAAKVWGMYRPHLLSLGVIKVAASA